MAQSDQNLDRLLRTAAKHREAGPEIPFGFDTRVVALARSQGSGSMNDARELSRWLRRIAVGAVVLMAFTGSAAYWQLSENEDAADTFATGYAIADSAMTTEFSQ